MPAQATNTDEMTRTAHNCPDCNTEMLQGESEEHDQLFHCDECGSQFAGRVENRNGGRSTVVTHRV